MSIVESLTGRPKAGPKSQDILANLKKAEAEIAELESQHGDAALDAITGEAGAQSRLEGLNVKLGTTRERASNLRAAHRAAIAREQAELEKSRAAIRANQIRALGQHLTGRDKSAKAIEDAVAALAKSYRELLHHSDKMVVLLRNLGAANPLPGDAFLEDHAIRNLLTAEFYRHAAGPNDGAKLPGAHWDDLATQHNPSGICSITEKLKTANGNLKKLMGGE